MYNLNKLIMSKIDFLKEQIIESRNFVNRLVSEIPENQWYTIPEGTDSNFAWQIGHLIISQNFHAITCITGTRGSAEWRDDAP